MRLSSGVVNVRASKPYVRMGIKVLWNIWSLVRWPRELFQTSLSFLYPSSAKPHRCLKAASKGFFHVIMEPKYLTCSVVGTAVWSENRSLGSGRSGWSRNSVLIVLRCIPYSAAWCSRALKMDCSCGMVRASRRVSSAYSRSLTGYPSDQVLVGTPCCFGGLGKETFKEARKPRRRGAAKAAKSL